MDDLPLFPLPLVLYPGERLPLHVFEPRYQALVARCLRDDTPFGILLAEEDRLAPVGCTARLDRILERHPDGRLDLLVRGERRFRLGTLHEARHAYLAADVAWLDEADEPLVKSMSERAIIQHMRLLELAKRDVRPSLYMVPHVSYVVAHNAGLTNAQKQEVLEIASENDRLAYLVGHLDTLVAEVLREEKVRTKVQTNGHFRDFLPPAA